MLFYLTLLAALILIVQSFRHLGVGLGVIMVLIVPIISLITFAVLCFVVAISTGSGEHKSEKVYALKSIGTPSEGRSIYLSKTVEGRGEREINYTTQDPDGAFRLKSVGAEDSYIYERDNEEPRLVVHTWEKEHWMMAPFPYWVETTSAFFVPTGSVAGAFKIDNE